MTEDMAAFIRQRQMDEEDERERRAAKRYLHCVHMEACERANDVLDGTMFAYDALKCEECPYWEAV